MENKSLDVALKEALTPSVQPRESLDQAILEKLGKRSGAGVRSVLPKAAAIILAIAVLGTGSVYAAGKILDNIKVLNHGVYVGNDQYINDEALAQTDESVEVEKKGEEMPGPDDKWTKKRSELVSGTYLNEYYTYAKYADAVEDTRFESLFSEIPGTEQSVTYVVTDLRDDTMEYSIDAIFEYEGGTISINQSVMEGNVAIDAAFAISMKQTGNPRTYVSKSGTEFSLVDDLGNEEMGVPTIVILASDSFKGYICFRDLTEEQIRQVLDLVVL